jgi:hypothetical protein
MAGPALVGACGREAAARTEIGLDRLERAQATSADREVDAPVIGVAGSAKGYPDRRRAAGGLSRELQDARD